MSVYLNLRKQFLNKIYFKHIINGQSPFMKHTNRMLKKSERFRVSMKHSLAQKYPNIIKADVEIVSIALTSECNLRCQGCSYGREFMPKEHIPLDKVKALLDDMKEMGIPFITFYGGEPLMIDSSKLVELVKYANDLGIYTQLGTNGVMLTPNVMDRLYEAGLRRIVMGMYGTDENYNTYVQKKDVFATLDENISYMRETYPDVSLSLGWLLMKPSCNLKSLGEVSEFALKHNIGYSIALVHYDFPYFNNGEDDGLQLFEEDLPAILEVQKELIALKKLHPNLILNSMTSLNAIPDWLMKKGEIDIPCYRYDHLWIGSNGEVRVCQKSALLGNINDEKFRDILNTKEHTQSTRDCFALNCSGCHVDYDNRTVQTPKSRKEYAN
ncbi:MAG: radical SAM protein [Sulfurovaceae bacterium]|nr:radical SAM protein [Sulfurovaceae bacterium]